MLPPEGPWKTLSWPQIYNRAQHLKAFSGLKINCRVPQAGNGDERMNRQHERSMLSGRGPKVFFALSVWVRVVREESVLYTFSSLRVLFPFICLFPIVLLCPSLAPYRLLNHTFLLLRREGIGRGRNGGGGGGWRTHSGLLTDKQTPLCADRQTHTHNTLSYILTETSAWLGSSWFYVPLLCLLFFSFLPLN